MRNEEHFWGEGAADHVTVHIVKWYLLKWCLLEFSGEGVSKAQIWGQLLHCCPSPCGYVPV